MLRSKYGNKKKYYGGEMFDSKRELKRYQELQMLERIGRISDLKRQVRFELIPEQREQSDEIYTRGPNKGKPKPGRIIEKAVNYVADFVYTEKGSSFF